MSLGEFEPVSFVSSGMRSIPEASKEWIIVTEEVDSPYTTTTNLPGWPAESAAAEEMQMQMKDRLSGTFSVV